MKSNYKYLVYIFALIIATASYGQKGKNAAKKEYKNFAYVKATEVLLQVAEKGYKSVSLFEKLANSYYFNNNMKEAAKWYKELIDLNEVIDPENYFRYAQALKFIEDYKESDIWMKKFYEVNKDDSRGKAFMSKVNYLSDIYGVSNDTLRLHNLNINTEYSDFGTTKYKDKIVFASSRGKGKIYKWNEQPFLELYSAVKENDSTFSKVINFDDEVNTVYHESSATFSTDQKFMFFTRNNYFKNKVKTDRDHNNRLKLYSARFMLDGTWGDIKPVHFNSDEYSVAHPVLNATLTKLYFASDMPGSKGMSDIYVADVNSDGTLGEPINLGTTINTEGRETFPFINERGDLFFSSNGYAGLGGLDIYIIKDFENKYARSEKLIIENLGKPINSPQDDFGYYENYTTKEAYLSSNRPNGKGDDDIYSFSLPQCTQLVEGIVKDKNTLELLPHTTIIIYDHEGSEVEKITVGEDAYFSFNASCEKTYLIRAEKEQYTSSEKRVITPRLKQELNLELLLEPEQKEVRPCDDLAKILGIPIIYFDLDKYNIRYDAEIELQKILAVMNQYPTMVVDIRSHTDCRSSYEYNERLSDNRAKSTRQYLINNGISPDRLTAKGYGEYQLINNCACEENITSNCTEEEHQLNRRSEFIVKSINGEKCND